MKALCSWWPSIDMTCILFHSKYKCRLSFSISRNEATLYEKSGFKSDEFFFTHKKVHNFSKAAIPFVVLFTHKETLCLHISTVSAWMAMQSENLPCLPASHSHPCCTQNPSQARATGAESWFLRSSSALGIEKVVMEMVSNKFYWLNETIF
jgi:hypothetical protein